MPLLYTVFREKGMRFTKWKMIHVTKNCEFQKIKPKAMENAGFVLAMKRKFWYIIKSISNKLNTTDAVGFCSRCIEKFRKRGVLS